MKQKNTVFARVIYVAVAALGFLSIGAHAASHDGLTPQECRSYPFVRTGHVTHRELMTELSEMEAVGYQPAGEDFNYPSKLDVAEHRLHREYREDCRSVGQ